MDRVYEDSGVCRKEGVAVAPVGVTNNMTVCYVSVNEI